MEGTTTAPALRPAARREGRVGDDAGSTAGTTADRRRDAQDAPLPPAAPAPLPFLPPRSLFVTRRRKAEPLDVPATPHCAPEPPERRQSRASRRTSRSSVCAGCRCPARAGTQRAFGGCWAAGTDRRRQTRGTPARARRRGARRQNRSCRNGKNEGGEGSPDKGVADGIARVSACVEVPSPPGDEWQRTATVLAQCRRTPERSRVARAPEEPIVFFDGSEKGAQARDGKVRPALQKLVQKGDELLRSGGTGERVSPPADHLRRRSLLHARKRLPRPANVPRSAQGKGAATSRPPSTRTVSVSRAGTTRSSPPNGIAASTA